MGKHRTKEHRDDPDLEKLVKKMKALEIKVHKGGDRIDKKPGRSLAWGPNFCVNGA